MRGVLGVKGMLIVSTPNRPVYSGEGGKTHFIDASSTKTSSSTCFAPGSSPFGSTHNSRRQPPGGVPIDGGRTLAVASYQGLLAFASWLCPAIRSNSARILPLSPDVILGRDTFPSTLFNPYIVRTRSKGTHERPYILVAVAEGVITA